MSDRSAIYAANPENAAEVRRALRICLSGMRPPGALTFDGKDFGSWARREFLTVLAPHAVAVHGMAARGDAAGLTAADTALTLPSASASAGRELLAQRAGARYLPVLRRFAGAVAEGKATGHFATVLALHASDFSVALLPLLQCLLYCEWRAGQAQEAACSLEDFFRQAGGILPSLPAVLTDHAIRSVDFRAVPGRKQERGRPR